MKIWYPAEIRRFREGLGETRPVFAERFLVTAGTVKDWESGRHNLQGPALRLMRLVALESLAWTLTMTRPAPPKRVGKPPSVSLPGLPLLRWLFATRKQFWGPTEIRRLRRELGETQQIFGERFYLTPGTVKDWENGHTKLQGPALRLMRLVALAARIKTMAKNRRLRAVVRKIHAREKLLPTIMG